MSNISSAALLTSVALLFATPIGLDAANGKVVTKPLCRLEVQNAHLSSTLRKLEMREVVKVNVSSICNVQQTRVLITLEIHKKGEFGDHVYGPFVNQQIPRFNSGLIVKLQDKYVDCRSSSLSKWFGIAYSRAFIAGRWQFAGKTQSPKVEVLPCGT